MRSNSNVFLANIVKGFFKKFFSGKTNNRFEKISWLTEKKIKHLDDFTEKQIALSGYQITYKKPYELLHTYEDIFQKEIYQFCSANNAPVILDCGSNVGFSVLYFKKIFPNAKVIAYEADGGNFELLQKNVVQNNLQSVDLNNKAVWVHNEGVQFSSKGTEASKIEMGNLGEETVPSVRLANVLSELGKVDFLKMDIEGAEYDVVTDCVSYLPNIDNMFIEYHGTVKDTNKLTKLLQMFDESGFRVYIKNAADFLEHPYVDKKVNSIYDVQLNIFCYK